MKIDYPRLAGSTARDGQFSDPEEVRRILNCRSVRDKIGIAIDCRLLGVRTLPAITELVRAGMIEWIDRAVAPHTVAVLIDNKDTTQVMTIAMDVYRLTPAGIALCEAEGIRGH